MAATTPLHTLHLPTTLAKCGLEGTATAVPPFACTLASAGPLYDSCAVYWLMAEVEMTRKTPTARSTVTRPAQAMRPFVPSLYSLPVSDQTSGV